MKHTFNRISQLIIFILLLSSSEKSFSQLSRIAIINLVDTTLLYHHIGFTMFTNKIDTFDCKFNCKKYIDNELSRFLSSKYSLSFITITDSLISSNGSIYNAWGIKKEVKLWLSNLKDDYEIVIFVESGEQADYMNQTNQILKSSGLYSRGNPIKSWAAVYSTVKFIPLRTSSLKTLDYGLSGMKYLERIKNYKFPEEKILIKPEMLPIIKTDLENLLAYKIEYFLTKSFLLPQDAYDKLKILKVD